MKQSQVNQQAKSKFNKNNQKKKNLSPDTPMSITLPGT